MSWYLHQPESHLLSLNKANFCFIIHRGPTSSWTSSFAALGSLKSTHQRLAGLFSEDDVVDDLNHIRDHIHWELPDSFDADCDDADGDDDNNGDNDDVDADAGDDDHDDQDRVRLYTLGTPQHQLWPRPTSS